MALLTYLLAIALVALVAFFFHLRRFRGIIERTGLPIVKPGLCLGSPPMIMKETYYGEWYLKKHQELGKTFGRYNGVTPSIVSIDPDFIREVTVKQFDNFTDVLDIEFSEGQTTLDVARGNTWRSLRKMLTPTFTGGKMKTMMAPIENLVNDTLKVIESRLQSGNPELDFKPIIGGFTIDVISKIAFGMDTKVRRGEDKEYMKTVSAITDRFTSDGMLPSVLIAAFFHLPEVAAKLGFWPKEAIQVQEMAKDIMKQRDANNSQIGDFVDRLREFKSKVEAPVTADMLDAQSMVFLTAGFETTANTLGSMIYLLATHAEAQDKVIEEIIDTIGSDEITYDNMASLNYLEACIMETLRMYPPVPEAMRTCTKSCVVNGIPIEKGTLIQIPIYPAHYSPEFFPDPEKFQPERFLKENQEDLVPYTWRPFGSGNRVCIGQRFALLEIKIFMAKFLTKFKLIKTDKTRMNLRKSSMLIYYPEMIAKIESRN